MPEHDSSRRVNMKMDDKTLLRESVARLSDTFLSPLDLLSHTDFREKCIDLVLNGIPEKVDQITAASFRELRRYLTHSTVDDAKVVVFGGGTGLSNVIGGDSRLETWHAEPFYGLKEVFPQTRSIVCVTDDGGSTGQLSKDLPLIALGDIRHVLLSSVQLQILQKRYSLTVTEAQNTVSSLATLFNSRFAEGDLRRDNVALLCQEQGGRLPEGMLEYIHSLVDILFEDQRLAKTLNRAQCLGNLLLAGAIYKKIPQYLDNIKLESNRNRVDTALYEGISELCQVIGAMERAVLPCTTTPAVLRFCYTNGVEVTGEHKSSKALRGFPVERAVVNFCGTIRVPEQIFEDIETADIILMAPGSLYSSIIPIFQVPGIADSVRRNSRAQKLLVSNLWVQTGETDITVLDPERKFHASDMIRAYEQNIPGGTRDLFREVLCLSLKDVPASILQSYALEGKIPIYLDKHIVYEQGYVPIECGIFSKKALAERNVIQHDPQILALAVKTVYKAFDLQSNPGSMAGPEAPESASMPRVEFPSNLNERKIVLPSKKYRLLEAFIEQLPIRCSTAGMGEREVDTLREALVEVIWKHQDIALAHLYCVRGILCVDKEEWSRDQAWDKVFSFFDPADGYIKIRTDQLFDIHKLEVAFLIALGQSLLGNYAKDKYVEKVTLGAEAVGKIYHLRLQRPSEITSFFSEEQLDIYLHLARMNQSSADSRQYTRLINGSEGFTPPGVLMGLTYAWYLDNRLASHIEYKMSLIKMRGSDLIPEQLKMLSRRHAIIHFFRETVFGRSSIEK